ncbi:hypothetical protein [Conexibacter arvalis]|uniref:DUF3068 domain-containing protein n=1 Tax=Conexibacter arvalis TaxID=912552 RepID=A0A840I8K0_9ACTN|nr:hypothetical protein [Conexibacter arvalis]MBB4661207.1 hypothetical protein [Conexibacter arvalis]
MPSRPRRALAALLPALACAVALLAAPLASAHQGDPRYRSLVGELPPALDGVTVEILNYDDRMELVNRGGRDVVIEGYNREPYARVDADGTVAVNRNSTAYYLNDDRYGQEEVPAAVRENPSAAPDWQVRDRTGRFEWHDHRMHWMARGVAPQVRDQSVRTKVFDWSVPLTVGGRATAVTGTLWWVGEQGGGFPVAAIVALVAVALAAAVAVVVVRRRRGGGDRRPAGEAW